MTSPLTSHSRVLVIFNALCIFTQNSMSVNVNLNVKPQC